MARWVLLAMSFSLALGAIDAHAARTLLTDLMKRPPAGLDEPAMSALALEACVHRAQELDRTGTAIDYEIAAVDEFEHIICANRFRRGDLDAIRTRLDLK